MKFITKYKSLNFDKRNPANKISFIVIHYTAMQSLDKTLKLLCSIKSKVSSHFLISKKGEIYKLVDENLRAWHAGKSKWKNIIDINSCSIGIELENSGHHLKFEKYNNKQINSLLELISYLKSKYNILETNIIGHSDVAPLRKKDPGEKFPWKILQKKHLCYLPNIKKIKYPDKLSLKNEKKLRKYLKIIGYDTNNRTSKKNLKKIIIAFQMHFQQDFVKGYPNKYTYLLAKKYCYDYYKEFID